MKQRLKKRDMIRLFECKQRLAYLKKNKEKLLNQQKDNLIEETTTSTENDTVK